MRQLSADEQRRILSSRDAFSKMLNTVIGVPSSDIGRFKTVWSAKSLRNAIIKACEMQYFRQDVTISCLDKMNSIRLPQVRLSIIESLLD